MTRAEIKQDLRSYRFYSVRLRNMINTEKTCLDTMKYFLEKGEAFKAYYQEQERILNTLDICGAAKQVLRFEKYAESIKKLPFNLTDLAIDWFINGTSMKEIINKTHYQEQTIYNMINDIKKHICDHILEGGKNV